MSTIKCPVRNAVHALVEAAKTNGRIDADQDALTDAFAEVTDDDMALLLKGMAAAIAEHAEMAMDDGGMPDRGRLYRRIARDLANAAADLEL